MGPVIGALFAKWSHSQSGDWFVVPALFAFALALLDLVFVIFFFKETLPKVRTCNSYMKLDLLWYFPNNLVIFIYSHRQNKRAKSVAGSLGQAIEYINPPDLFMFKAVKNISQTSRYSHLKWIVYLINILYKIYFY